MISNLQKLICTQRCVSVPGHMHPEKLEEKNRGTSGCVPRCSLLHPITALELFIKAVKNSCRPQSSSVLCGTNETASVSQQSKMALGGMNTFPVTFNFILVRAFHRKITAFCLKNTTYNDLLKKKLIIKLKCSKSDAIFLNQG